MSALDTSWRAARAPTDPNPMTAARTSAQIWAGQLAPATALRGDAPFAAHPDRRSEEDGGEDG